MNRSALLVICDFLILTLLSFVNFDSTSSGPAPAAEPSRTVAAPAMSNMVATLETALELEREQREALTNALASTSAQLAERLRVLAEREQALSNTERRLQQAEIEARRLAEERTRLERSQGEASASVRELQKAFETAKESTGSLQSALTDSVREAAAAKARLSVIEEELTQRREDTRTMQERIVKLDETRERLSDEKQQLALELRETTVEARVVRQTVTNLNHQLVKAETEKTKLIQTTSELATNVGALKEESTAIRQQSTAIREQSTAIREQIDRQTRLPANTIYSGFLSNRVRVDTSGITRASFVGESTRRREAATVLVRHAGRVFVVLHIEGTALRIWPPDAPWTALGAEVGRLDQRVKGLEMALVRRDPRVVAIPVDEAAAQALGARIYDVATDPAQFAEAVVIGGEEAYYGECAFHLSTDNPGYLQMERSTVRRLLGEFNPRRGDLALTKTGQFLGILVNGDHCLPFHLAEFLPGLRLGEGLNPAPTVAILRTAQATLERLPASLK